MDSQVSPHSRVASQQAGQGTAGLEGAGGRAGLKAWGHR